MKNINCVILCMILVSCASQPEPQPQLKIQPTMSAVSSMQSNYQIPLGSRVAWLENGRDFQVQQIQSVKGLQQMIEQAVVTEINAKGLRFQESVQASDFLVSYVAALEGALNDDELMNRYGIMPGKTMAQNEPDIIEKGTLILYLVEADTRRLVWRSALQAAIHKDIDEQTRQQRVNSAIRIMLNSLPVQ